MEGGLLDLTKEVRSACQSVADVCRYTVHRGRFGKLPVAYGSLLPDMAGRLIEVNQPNDFMLAACSMGILDSWV